MTERLSDRFQMSSQSHTPAQGRAASGSHLADSTYHSNENEEAIQSQVLIVEDDEAIRFSLEAFFDLASIPTFSVDCGLEALRALDRFQSPPRVVLLDGRLPDIHGLQLAQNIRARFGQSIAIFLCSADTESHIQGNSIGLPPGTIDGFIAKPFDADEVVRLVLKQLKLRNSSQIEMTAVRY